MPLLTDHRWRARYDPDDGLLAAQFYVPALACAQRYDRITGYFNASALAIAARGVEGLVLNAGRMRLVVGCTLDAAEVEAVERGQSLRDTVQAVLLRNPLAADRAGAGGDAARALELLAWMVARGFLEMKVAVPCDERREPVAGTAIFHPKAGVIEDKTGARLAFAGSVNETAQGWLHNWESFHVFCDWNGGAEHVDAEEGSFARLWADKARRARVLDVPAAVREDLLRFLPEDDREPERLRRARHGLAAPADGEPPQQVPGEPPPSVEEQRRAVWQCIWGAPMAPEGLRIAEATSAVMPWPHQTRAFRRMVDHWPPRLLIADEVGLGKTIETGLLLRHAWLSRRAKRILVLAPKGLLAQWQIELREKFNLNWPIYDGKTLCWYPSPALRGRNERDVNRADWHREPFVIASSQLMRRRDRQSELTEAAEAWDLVVLDEAHHARHNSPGSATEGPPNLLLSLMRKLAVRTRGLVLLTATPMQVHPVEVYDLLALLGMPSEWGRAEFVEFFRRAADPNPSPEVFEQMARLYQAAERAFGETPLEVAMRRVPGNTKLRATRVLRALHDPAAVPRRQLSADDRRAALAVMRVRTPVAALVSRHTRELLREYRKRGLMTTPIAEREVIDEFLAMSADEARVYAALEDYVGSTYNAAAQDKRSAVGFVMTIYRKRLASSFFALRRTLEDRLAAVQLPQAQSALFDTTRLAENAADGEDDAGDVADEDTAREREFVALQVEEQDDIEALLAQVRGLAADTKAQRLVEVLRALRAGSFRAGDGSLLPAFAQAIVFTQFTDTLDYLRDHLRSAGFTILCFSGRGGEWLQPDGSWRRVSREETKRRFKAREADVLVCTEAAAEGLNFQFCGALVNFDMPWNPMRVEQRIGRVDRLGQQFERIAIVNLLYEGTIETEVYRVLRERISLFTSVVGKLQPILSAMPTRLAEATLAPPAQREQVRSNIVSGLRREIEYAQAQAFDLYEMVDAVLDADLGPPPAYDLDTLNRLLDRPLLLPDGVEAERNGSHEVFWTEPGRARVAVTTDAEYFEDNADSLELWSPGGGAFPAAVDVEDARPLATKLDVLLG